MLLLHCIPHLEHGGAQRHLCYLVESLTRMGHKVHIAYLTGGPNLGGLEEAGGILHRLPRRNYYDPFILIRLVRLIKQIRPDLVHTWLLQQDVMGGLAAEITRTPWIVAEQASMLAYPPSWKVALRTKMAQYASTVISNSQAGRHYWQSLLPQKKLYEVRNGLPLDRIEAAVPGGDRELGLRPDHKMVLFVGRFDEQMCGGKLLLQKNLDNLVTALALVLAEPGVMAVLGGDGPRMPVVKKLVEKLGIADRVLLPGFVSNTYSLMKRAEVFVSVSFFEGQPNTVQEAMVCGCPLVVSDIPEHREFLDEKTALFANPRDPQDIAKAIMQTLNAPEEARRRAAIAQARARRWTISEMARQYERVYLEILSQQR